MALKSIEMENFRNQSNVKYEVYGSNLVLGKNGVGKSTLKEALAFLFCGTDSIGFRNPQHLIQEGTDGLKVVGVTDRAVISRTLSKKGNSTIKVIKDGVPMAVTQTQMEQMMGSVDLCLSSLIPGYFTRLPTEKQHKVISEVMPEIDRHALFAELAGFELSSEERLRYSLARRTDLLVKAVAADRLAAEKAIATHEGELRRLQEVMPVDKPEQPSDVSKYALLKTLKDEWSEYERQMKAFTSYQIRLERIEKENAQRANRTIVLDQYLKELVETPEPVITEYDKEIEGLTGQKLSLPAKPAVVDVPDADFCHACGQTVGLKHREKVRAENLAKMGEWETESIRVKEHNSKMQEQINHLFQLQHAEKEQLEKIRRDNKVIQQKRRVYELERAALKEDELPTPIPTPVAPTEVFSEAEFEEAKRGIDSYNAKMAQWEYVQQRMEAAKGEIATVKASVARLTEQCDRLRTIERVFKLLPQEELKRQMAAFTFPTLRMVIDDSISIFRGDRPYELLSTGDTMRADIEICYTFNNLMKKPISMIFVDNVDLLDEFSIGDRKIQWFAAKVDPGLNETQIHEVTGG